MARPRKLLTVIHPKTKKPIGIPTRLPLPIELLFNKTILIKEHELAVCNPNDWLLAAEPWIGAHPPYVRVRRAIEMAQPVIAQSEIAKKIGLDKSTYSNLLNNRRTFTNEILFKLSKELDVSSGWLTGGVYAVPVRIHKEMASDFFDRTPSWLHEKLLFLLKRLGHPDNYFLEIKRVLNEVLNSTLGPLSKFSDKPSVLYRTRPGIILKEKGIIQPDSEIGLKC